MKRSKQQAHRAPDPAKLAPKASGGDLTLHTRTIGVLPIINQLIQKLRLKAVLDDFLPTEDGRNKLSTANALLLLVRNVLLSREPIYGIGGWAAAYVPELLGLREDQLKSLNDDRVGRALDWLTGPFWAPADNLEVGSSAPVADTEADVFLRGRMHRPQPATAGR